MRVIRVDYDGEDVRYVPTQGTAWVIRPTPDDVEEDMGFGIALAVLDEDREYETFLDGKDIRILVGRYLTMLEDAAEGREWQYCHGGYVETKGPYGATWARDINWNLIIEENQEPSCDCSFCLAGGVEINLK